MIAAGIKAIHVNRVELFTGRYINIMMLFFPLTTFLLLPSVPGTTVITMLAAALFFPLLLLPAGPNKAAFFNELFIFITLLLLLSFTSQFINLVSNLKLSDELVLINRKGYTKTFYRASHITQSMSLVVGFIIYGYVKYFSNADIVKYIYWGLRLICFYALYEFVFYLITGTNGDFMVNRTFGYEEKSASLFQTVSLGGLNIMRVKGYTGEPSMFVFTVLPFWVLSIALGRKFDQLLMFGCLVLTFSTTAYLCIGLFLLNQVIRNRHFLIFYYLSIAVIVLCFILQLDQFQHLLNSLYDFVFSGKLEGNSVSARDRGNHFTEHLMFWSERGWFSQLFGIGFGYIRSTDFFSTLLVNTGIIGFALFSRLVFRNMSLNIAPKNVLLCYRSGLLLMYFIMMATVPEFAYPSLWIYLALGFVLERFSFTSPSSTPTSV